MIQQPQLVLCRGAGTPAMLSVGGVYEDDGETYEMIARTRPFAPGGEGGEAIFTTLWMTTTTFDDAVSLFVTPYVDFVALETQRIDIAGEANPTNKQRVHELALSVPFMRGLVEIMRNAPRGTWFDVKVETKIAAVAGSSARQIIDGFVVETEVVRESKRATGVTV